MRLGGVPWSVVCLLAAALPLLAEHPDPNQILRATREFLGGEKNSPASRRLPRPVARGSSVATT